MSDKPFTIKRKNLTAIKHKKEGTVNKDDAPPTKEQPTVDRRYQKRLPLNKVQSDFMKDFYYKRSGMSGRDVLYKQLQAHYAKHSTPQNMQISRRRMWDWLSKQEVNQLHKPASKTSVSIKPITASAKLERAQFDLIIKGGDSARKWKGIACLVDVATRKAWTELLQDTTSKAVANALDKILTRVEAEIPDGEKNTGEGVSKTFKAIQSDNGSEMKADFAAYLKSKNINQIFGVANRSTSQALVERFNRSLFIGIQKEITATNGKWYDLLKKHTDFYNDKTNRMLRRKEPSDPDGPYKVYTPNELWKESKATLQQLKDEKEAGLSQGKKLGEDTPLELGNTVRLKDFGKMKSGMAKGFKQNWSIDLYEIIKVKPPPAGKEGSRPYVYYVKNKETGASRLDANRRYVAYTRKDLQVVDADVQKAPDDIQVVDKDTVKTRSKAKQPDAPPAPSTPPLPPKQPAPPPIAKPKKPAPKPPQQDPLIGKRVKSADAKGKITGKGTIIRVIKKGKGGKKWEVEWDTKYNYSNGRYTKKDIDQMLMM